LLSLAVLTGNIGKKGAGFNYANLQSYVFDDVKEPMSYYADQESDKPFRRSVSMAKLGSDMLKTIDPELKAIWIERGNPVLQSPDTNSVKKAFSALKFIVVVEQFMTDTASCADIILPAKDIFDQSDIVGSYWSPYIQFKPKILKSPGQVMPESEIYYNLAKRMKLDAGKELIPEPGNINIEKWLEMRISGYSHLSLDDLRKGPVLAPGLQKIAYGDFKFDTPSGKIELYSSGAAEKWKTNPLPSYNEIISRDEDKNFPLVFLTPNSANRIHSQFGNLKIIKDTTPESRVKISPFDAKSRCLKNGQKIRVFNDLGELVSKVLISERVPPGIAVLSNGAWIGDGGGGNYLIEGKETDMGFGAAFHDNRVEIEGVDLP
jgi:anaerobic selenocysteine-containing dehydrogenase